MGLTVIIYWWCTEISFADGPQISLGNKAEILLYNRAYIEIKFGSKGALKYRLCIKILFDDARRYHLVIDRDSVWSGIHIL